MVKATALAERISNFGPTIDFYAPGLKRWQTQEWQPKNSRRFLPVSVTGNACALQCDHCQAKVLEGMVSVRMGQNLFTLAEQLKASGSEGLLVSGGSLVNGSVPLKRHLKYVRRIKEELGMKVVVHSGVVTPTTAEALANSGVDAVMLDIIGADETIRDVYHLSLQASDFDRSLELLSDANLRIIPHIVIGLHYGKLLGEWNALEMIKKHSIDTLILVILTPLIGTPMAHIPPPSLDDVVSFFHHARQNMATSRINLGCARPMGLEKLQIDRAAVELGLNGIAYPAEGIIEYAKDLGLTPKLYEWCCSMSWAGTDDNLTQVALS